MKAARPLASGSPDDTRKLGERLGRLHKPGDVVLLSGELGAGKTVFVQGIARGLGFDGSVSSKSFVLMGEYPGRITLYHADLYRLEDAEQVLELALDEVSAEGVLVVEWPERAGEGVLPAEHLRIEFSVKGEDVRELQLRSVGDRAQKLVDSLNE